MHDYQVRFGETVIAAPTWWFDAVLIWLAAMGIVFFLFGRRLIRPAFAALGLLIGAGFGWVLCNSWITNHWPGAPVMIFVISGAVLGAIALGLLWRLGIGVTLAVAVAIVAPAAYIILSGATAPPIDQPILTARDEIRQQLDTSRSQEVEQVPQWSFEPVTRAAGEIYESIRSWWDNLTAGPQWALGALCIGGALIAMFLGMALPMLSASTTTALIGALFMIGLLYRLAHAVTDSQTAFLPHSPRGFLWLILALTLTGVLIQWTLLRPPPKPAA